MHCSDYKARGASGNYEAWGASGDYEAWGASGDYEARGASGGKYEARMVIFCILAAVNRFSWILGKQKAVEEIKKPLEKFGKPLKKAESH
jgi:hypothetical protein